jgi:arylsulfatase A-like enzyme
LTDSPVLPTHSVATPSLARALLRILWPSGPALLAVAMALLWRAAMLAARGVLEADALHALQPPQVRALVKGALWDVLLVLGMVLLLRSLALLAVQRGRTLAGPKLLATLLAVTTTVLRAADLGHCYLVRSHFSAESFLYVQGGYSDRLLSSRGLGLVAVVVTAILTLTWALRRDLQGVAVRAAVPIQRFQGLPRAMLVLVPALLGLGLAGRVVLDAWRYPPHEFELRVVPELNFARQLRIYSQDAADRATLQIPIVPVDMWLRWQAAGLVPRNTSPAKAYPLYRPGLAEPPVPYPRRPGAPEQPDVVLTLMESMNRVFVDELSGHFRGLMPQLGGLIRSGALTSVDGYWNTTSPTIAGTVASLCSLFSPVHPGDLHGRSPIFGNAHYLCMAEVLRQAGYRTAFIQGADLVGADTDKFLVAHGFDEVLADAALARRFPHGERTEMGYHDADVVTLAKEYITRLEALKKKDGRPYFVVIATLDTHEPGLGGPDCPLPRDAQGQLQVADVPDDPSGQRVLAAYHCSDKALGALGAFLLAPGRGERVLWALTGDHAAFRTLANDSVFKGLGLGWSFDRLPLLIHDPVHVLPRRVEVLSGSLDVAPTLLHLLGQDGAPTDMMGHSVFGTRPDLPFLAGRIGSRRAFVKTREAERELPLAEVRALCQRHEPLLAGPTPVDACDLALWFDWQDALWALRRLAPPAGRDGLQAAHAGP